MSLMKTLAKVAIGVAVAKGAHSMMNRRSDGRGSSGGGLLDALTGGRDTGRPDPSDRTGMESVMEGVFTGGGTTQQASRSSGGLGGLLDDLGTSNTEKSKKVRLDDLSDAFGQDGIDMGNALPGDIRQQAQAKRERDGSFGQVLNSQFGNDRAARKEPTLSQEAAAGLMIKAMIQAAKSDGRFDEDERARILDKLDDATAEERQFVHQALSAPVDAAALARETPPGLEAQIYGMSLLGIDLDTQDEAQHLHKLAEGLGLSRQTVNDIHSRMGVTPLYR